MATPHKINTPADDRPPITPRADTHHDSDGTRPPVASISPHEQAKTRGDEAVTPGDTDDRPIRRGNESSYPPRADSIEETAFKEPAPRQRGYRLTVEPPGYVSLTDEQRREAVAALAALLAPLLTERFVQKG